MKEDLREFYDCLNLAEQALSAEVAVDRLGLLMRVAINELDLDFEGVLRENASAEQDNERSYIMRIGVARIIKLAMAAHRRFDVPTATIQRDMRYSGPVLSLIAMAGTIEHGRRVAQSLFSSGGRIEKLEGRFRITLPSKLPDFELHERELERFHVQNHRSLLSSGYEAIVGQEIGDEVRTLLTDLVYCFATHFIGYESDPKLDDYFFGHAYTDMLLAKGYDTFHFSTKFGGVTFSNFKLAATFVVSVAMKHRAFVRALMEKVPSIRIEDVLTVSVETSGYLEGLRDFINEYGQHLEGHEPVTDEHVRMIFNVLSISRRNLALLERPGAPIPPLIQCSDGHVIRPLAGATSNEVMLFLLNALQHSFPKDYDRAQRAREGVMQRAVEKAIRELLPALEYRGNIKLRQSGRVVTDLDLVIVEQSSDRVVLVQLKHQDPYGGDLATMLARTGRLNQQVSDWILKVRSWLTTASPPEVRATLRLPSGHEMPKISLLVLTRHYAYSLRKVVNDGNAMFANWNQLVTAIERLREQKSIGAGLDTLLKELQDLSMPEVIEYLPEPASKWQVGNLRFTIEQESD